MYSQMNVSLAAEHVRHRLRQAGQDQLATLARGGSPTTRSRLGRLLTDAAAVVPARQRIATAPCCT